MLRIRQACVLTTAALFMALLSATGGCGSSGPKFGNDVNASTGDDDASASGNASGGGSGSDGTPSFGSGSSDGGGSSGSCSDGSLSCFVRPDCTTTLSGTVFDPAGANPLYNVVVFVPNDPKGTLPPIAAGTKTCSTCDVSIGNYVTATTSDAKGHFTLTGVPATTHVPLVVQIGKWRREVFLPQVTACKDNAVPASQSRLPKNKSEGSLPQMALLTGGADNLGCFLTGIGVDPKEYTAPHAGGHVDVYRGLPGPGLSFGGVMIGGAPGLSNGTAGDCTTSSCPLWNATTSLEKYDIVLLSCEGAEFNDSGGGGNNGGGNKSRANKQALHDWLNEGGKVFATHFHYTWFKNGPNADFQNVANWLGKSGAGDSKGPNYDLDTSFPKGKTFHDWLANVNALTGPQIGLTDVAISVSSVSKDAQRWIYESLQNEQDTKYLSFLTPIGGVSPSQRDAGPEMNTPQYCGKAVFSDLHAGGSPVGDVPDACGTGNLSAQYKALEFLFFDLSACVAPDNVTPDPIPPPAK